MPRDHVTSTRGVGALGTFVRLLAGMCALVRGQVVASREHLAAHLARIRLDAGVQPHMAGQHVAAGERALANVARITATAAIATACGRAERIATATAATAAVAAGIRRGSLFVAMP